MIEQKASKELNKEQIELKLSSLTFLDMILLISGVAVLLTATFALFTLLDKERPLVLKFLFAIPTYKVLLAVILGIRAQRQKQKCLDSHKISLLNSTILLNIAAFALLLRSTQQYCAILTGFSSVGSYSYYIVIITSIMSLFLLRTNIVLKVSAAMAAVASIDFILYLFIKSTYAVTLMNVKEDVLILANSALVAALTIIFSCYIATIFHRFFTLYCMREAKLRHYKSISETDALTKLSNRRAFDLDLELISTASIKTVAVAMFDIDDFKKFNDEYGHSTGDYVLEQVGKLISIFNDYNGVEAYRYGGEELTVVFSYVSASNNIEEQIELFRHTVSNVKIPNVKRNITISAGLAYSNIGAVQAGEERKKALLELVNEADKNLYEAKHTGKNKLCTSHIKLTKNKEV